MGCGNVYIGGKYEGLYYVDNEHLVVYHREGEPESKAVLKEVGMGEQWEYDEVGTRRQMRHFEETLCKMLRMRFPSFVQCSSDNWITNCRRAILENKLFFIALEDNQWSMAVELVQKEDDYRTLEGLQAWHYQRYLDGIRGVLLDMYGEVSTRAGAWTCSTIWAA